MLAQESFEDAQVLGNPQPRDRTWWRSNAEVMLEIAGARKAARARENHLSNAEKYT